MKKLTAVILSILTALSGLFLFCNATEIESESSTEVELDDNELQQIDDYKQQQQELDDKIEQSKEKINSLKGDINDQQSYVNELSVQVNNYQAKIDVLNSQINSLEAQKTAVQYEIDAKNEEIAKIEAEINHNELKIISIEQESEDVFEELKERLCNMYVYGTAGTIELLLASKSFVAFLEMNELMSATAKHDDEMIALLKSAVEEVNETMKEQSVLIEDLNADKQVLKEKISSLNAAENEIIASRTELENSQASIQEIESEAYNYLQKLDKESALYKSMVANYEAQQAELDSKIEQIIKNAQRGDYEFVPSDGYIWPLQYSDVYISSGYGYRAAPWSGWHGGVDTCCWSGTQGKTVVATASGEVIYSGFNGYGNCIIIDHGNGISSVYGHLDSKAVSEGQLVNQGDVIGYAGNTYGPGGYSTGAHLHFEIRVDGQKTNPLNYCSP